MNKTDKIYIAGHSGLVGRALVKGLRSRGYENILTRNHAELDLTRQADVEAFFAAEKPDVVFLAAARVGGILANSSYPADFIRDNLAIALNVIEAAHGNGVRKLCNLGSSCIYPRLAPQPIKEDSLLSGPLEPSNEAYAVAKIAAIHLCKHYNRQYGCDFLSLMPTNLYGPGDHYDPETSHVLPALIRKFHEAGLSGGPVMLWGDGSPRREFLYSEDLADAALFLMETRSAVEVGEIINVGTGVDLSIKELAGMVAGIVGYEGEVKWDVSKPNGTPRKLLDVSRLTEMGWSARMRLEEGIALAYKDYLG